MRRLVECLLRHRRADTPCGWVRSIGREGEEKRFIPLSALADTRVDMFTTVIVGNRETRMRLGRMLTPRGYRL